VVIDGSQGTDPLAESHEAGVNLHDERLKFRDG
jgi:hypothetical protein